MITLEQALTVRTEAEVRADLSDEIAARGGDDQGFPDTSTPRLVLDVDSQAISAKEAILRDLVRSTSLSMLPSISVVNGRDAWIDHAAEGRYSLSRDPATRALHVFTLTNSINGVARTFAPGQLRARFGTLDFLNVTVDGITDYLGSGSLPVGGTLELLFECQTAGTSGNIPPNVLTQLVTVYAGVTIANPPIGSTGRSIYRSARDAESNPSLLDRMTSRMGASSAGGCNGSIVQWIHEAFRYAGLPMGVTKWLIDDTNPDGPGTTRVYLADDAGPASAEKVAIVQAYLAIRRTSGSGMSALNPGILALPSVAVPIAINATLKNSTNTAAATGAQAVIVQLNKEAPLGGWRLYRNELIERLMGIEGTVNVPFLDFEDTTFAAGESPELTATIAVVP